MNTDSDFRDFQEFNEVKRQEMLRIRAMIAVDLTLGLLCLAIGICAVLTICLIIRPLGPVN